MNSKRSKIGTVTIPNAGQPVTENHTRYAADHRTYTVQPGTYDVEYDGYWVLVTVRVIQTSETLVSRLLQHSSAKIDNTVRNSTKTYQLYDYEVARHACTDRPLVAGGYFRLADDWAVRVTHSEIPWGDDGPRHHTSRKLVHVPAEQPVEIAQKEANR